MDVALWGIGVLVVGVVAFLTGRSAGERSGKADAQQEARGEVEKVTEMLDGARRKATALAKERDEVVDRTLSRVLSFLEERVSAPLREAAEAGGGLALSEATREALDAVEDLAFFLHPPVTGGDAERCNLTGVVTEAAREFTEEWEIPIKVKAPAGPLHVRVAPEEIKDALFLLFSNAGHFGGDSTVDVVLEEADGHRVILIRDRGPGFSAEALERGMDPFFSTRPGGLGLGLPHAHKILLANGAEMALRNLPAGGGEVEIRFPGG